MPHSHHPTASAQNRRRLGNGLAALAVAAALLVLTAATAGAMPNRADAGLSGLTQTTVRVIVPTSGFDWLDAGIGAAAGLAVSLIAIGSALAVNRRRGSAISATR